MNVEVDGVLYVERIFYFLYMSMSEQEGPVVMSKKIIYKSYTRAHLFSVYIKM